MPGVYDLVWVSVKSLRHLRMPTLTGGRKMSAVYQDLKGVPTLHNSWVISAP